MHLSKVSPVCSNLYEIYSSNYVNELLSSYRTCIFTMYYCIIVCHHVISHNLTLVKLLHGFASNYVWMFLLWTPTKIVRSRTATSIFERMIGNFEYFGANKVKLFFSETTGHKSFIYHG